MCPCSVKDLSSAFCPDDNRGLSEHCSLQYSHSLFHSHTENFYLISHDFKRYSLWCSIQNFGSSWPRIGTAGGDLWLWWWAFRFHKMRGISWLAKNLLASQEALCSMEYGVNTPTEFSKGFLLLKCHIVSWNTHTCYCPNNSIAFPELIFCGTHKHWTTLYADPLCQSSPKSDCKCWKYG